MTLQSTAFWATFLSGDKHQWRVPVCGIFISWLRYVAGAQDRYLVALYRRQIQNLVLKIKHYLQLFDYYYIGQTEDIPGEVERIKDPNIRSAYYQWRCKHVSTTRLAAIIPLIMLFIWTVACLGSIMPSFSNKVCLASQ